MKWQRKPPVLYGWVIVCAGLWVTLVLFGLTNAFSVFFKPLSVEFGWDRGVTSLAYSISWLSFGVLSIGAGRLVDRYGPRAVMLGGLGIFVVGTLLLSQIRSLWQLYVIFGVVLSIGRAANLIPLITTVLGWFNTRRGLALALAQSQGVGTVLMVPLAAWLIAQYGWRFSYTVLGVFILVTAAPVLLLIRQAPGGARGAGARVPSRPSEPAQSLEPQDWTLRQALRSHTFWVANAIVFCCCTCHSVLLLHLINFFTDQGMPASHAATILRSYPAALWWGNSVMASWRIVSVVVWPSPCSSAYRPPWSPGSMAPGRCGDTGSLGSCSVWEWAVLCRPMPCSSGNFWATRDWGHPGRLHRDVFDGYGRGRLYGWRAA